MPTLGADAAFRPLHQALWDKALFDFRWLDRDGWVQQTTFSDGSTLAANFTRSLSLSSRPTACAPNWQTAAHSTLRLSKVAGGGLR
ncbi:TPA: glycoside hydrolase [Serratia marcescens]|uniref:glycoside hydrolase n=1 Tax=Serratia marcescens TaxID=615 RepID=UPI001E4A13CE|nr:glycoside hydrolase [Serratia marcescens]